MFWSRLGEFVNSSPSSRVLLVPSTRDILSNHAVFPQPDFDHTLPKYDVRTCVFSCLATAAC